MRAAYYRRTPRLSRRIATENLRDTVDRLVARMRPGAAYRALCAWALGPMCANLIRIVLFFLG